MGEPSSLVTRASLLMQLQQAPADQAAWTEFVERYGLRIYGWCRRWGLQEADAQDVTQTVLLKLVRSMQTFVYDPSRKFRAWLKTVTQRAWQDWVSNRQPAPAGGEGSADDLLQSIEARDDLTARLEAAWEQELLDRALQRVRQRVQPQTWDAFRLTAFDGLSGAQVALRLGMPVISVYKAKSNVQKLLEGEVRNLEEGGV
jgi:RNA polymerase sigma factor (sigma-70 family)